MINSPVPVRPLEYEPMIPEQCSPVARLTAWAGAILGAFFLLKTVAVAQLLLSNSLPPISGTLVLHLIVTCSPLIAGTALLAAAIGILWGHSSARRWFIISAVVLGIANIGEQVLRYGVQLWFHVPREFVFPMNYFFAVGERGVLLMGLAGLPLLLALLTWRNRNATGVRP